MPTTLKDIAKASGFSVTTVSRALTGYDDVNIETRNHITAIAQQLGYQPNHIARQLKSQKTFTLGLVMPERMHIDEDDFFSMLLRGITYEAARNGFDVLTSATQPDKSELATYKRIVGGKRVDGMILARTFRDDPRIRYLKKANIPFIVHGRLSPEEISDFHYIDVDSEQGIYLATQHLIAQGHTHIGIILPDPHFAFTSYRLNGYRRGLQEHRISYQDVYCEYGDFTYQSGQLAASKLLDRNPKLTAIIGANDWMALGAMHTVKQQSYIIGENFSIVGYDNILASAHANPSLTTVRQPIYNIGEELTRYLIEIIRENPEARMQKIIQPELIIRESSGSLR